MDLNDITSEENVMDFFKREFNPNEISLELITRYNVENIKKITSNNNFHQLQFKSFNYLHLSLYVLMPNYNYVFDSPGKYRLINKENAKLQLIEFLDTEFPMIKKLNVKENEEIDSNIVTIESDQNLLIQSKESIEYFFFYGEPSNNIIDRDFQIKLNYLPDTLLKKLKLCKTLQLDELDGKKVLLDVFQGIKVDDLISYYYLEPNLHKYHQFLKILKKYLFENIKDSHLKELFK